ncbi:MAG: hypothetical protein QM775_22870 [Pirellulales bacterium]
MFASANADAIQFGRRIHLWGRFRPGSWVVMRQGMESLDPQGQVIGKSVSETRMTLADADDQALTLKVQSSLEIGDRKLENPPQELRQGPLGEPIDAVAVPQELPADDVTIQGQRIRCEVRRTESTSGARRQVVTTWVNPNVAPYVLRKVTTLLDATTGRNLGETVMEVVSLSTERRVLARNRTVAEVRTVQRHPRGQTTTQAICCPEIPGGVVSQTSHEFDAGGQLIRRTQLDLVDFETK